MFISSIYLVHRRKKTLVWVKPFVPPFEHRTSRTNSIFNSERKTIVENKFKKKNRGKRLRFNRVTRSVRSQRTSRRVERRAARWLRPRALSIRRNRLVRPAIKFPFCTYHCLSTQFWNSITRNPVKINQYDDTEKSSVSESFCARRRCLCRLRTRAARRRCLDSQSACCPRWKVSSSCTSDFSRKLKKYPSEYLFGLCVWLGRSILLRILIDFFQKTKCQKKLSESSKRIKTLQGKNASTLTNGI